MSAGSTPCVLRFRFENRDAMSVEVGYRVRVIPPPVDTVVEGRRRRTRRALDFVEEDLSKLIPRTASTSMDRRRTTPVWVR